MWLIVGADPPYPESRPIRGLSDSTSIQWTSDGAARIETVDSTDFYSALGYVHGMNRGWTMTLWRQTALGRLSRWFGTKVVPLDAHARRLGFARQAQKAFETLPRSEKRRLRAYARGVNAALTSSAVREGAPFLVLDIQPNDWAPWHALLIERLTAWIATPHLSPPTGAPRAIEAFCKVDRQFRRWLHLHGWQRSVAWAIQSPRPEASPILFQRHVLGATAAPTLQEIEWSHAGEFRLSAATLPGALLFPTGRTNEQAWSSLLKSPASLHPVPLDSSTLQHWTERIDPTDGDEQLLQVRRQNDALLLARSTNLQLPRPDSNGIRTRSFYWALRWPGLTPRSDVSAWLTRAGQTATDWESSRFGLFERDGLRVSEDGSWTILGSPSVVERDSTGSMVLVGQSVWARQQANGLRALTHKETTPSVEAWSSSDSSTWAADLLPHLQDALESVAQTNSRLENATTYVQNWDHHYGSNSIGATLFDQWMRSYRSDVGHLPTVADTGAFFASYRQERALRRAVDTLSRELGHDARRWRWDRVVSDRRYFPVWSADSLINKDLETMRTTRYAPLRRSAKGHPSTLGGGPSPIARPPLGPAPTRWEGWLQLQGRWKVRRHHFDPTSAFARSGLLRDQPSAIVPFSGPPAHTTTLVPAKP